MDGSWVEYHDNGQAWRIGTFKEGLVQGPYEIYYENGQLAGKGNVKNGMDEGHWVYYHEDGTVDEEYTGTYRNGEKVD